MSKAKMLGGGLLGATGAVGGALAGGHVLHGDKGKLISQLADLLHSGGNQATLALALAGGATGAGVANLLSRSGAAKLQAAARAKKIRDAAAAAALLGGGAAGGYALAKSDS